MCDIGDYKKNNRIRILCAIAYCLIGVLCFSWFFIFQDQVWFSHITTWFSKIKPYGLQILWSLGWGAIGIALGLYNSRTDKHPTLNKIGHYVFYFGFLLFIATLTAIVAFRTSKGSWAASALAGLIVGFMGDKFGSYLNAVSRGS